MEHQNFVKGKLVAVSGSSRKIRGFSCNRRNNRFINSYGLNLLEEKVGLVLPAEAFQTGVFNLSDEQKAKLDNEVKLFVEKL